MHQLNDFKNFAVAELDLFQPLTILLGRNGSGKTNVIEGIELLAALAQGVPLTEITDLDRGGTFELRGGLHSCARFGESKIGLLFSEGTISFRETLKPVQYSIWLADLGMHGFQLFQEELRVGNQVFFEAENLGGDLLTIKYANFLPGRDPSCQMPATRSVLARYEEVISMAMARNSSAIPKLSEPLEIVQSVREYLRRSFIFDPQPKTMRGYARAESRPELLRDGTNLSAVLFALRRGDEQQRASLERITETIRQIPEEPFQEIGFVETPLGDVIAGFATKDGAGPNGNPHGKQLLDARILSDGTLRMLAIATALETVPKHSRIVIEELDNGLHPSRAKLLVQALTEASRRRGLNVLATTHNPAFMDALDESQMDSVLICHRDEAGGGSRITPLGDLDIAATLALRGGLGDFVTRGALERHLAPDIGKQRSQAARDWLASLP